MPPASTFFPVKPARLAGHHQVRRVTAMVGASGPASCHTRALAAALARSSAPSAVSTSAARVAIVRERVGSKATGPNTAGSARTTARSEQASPPSATSAPGRGPPWPGRGPPAVSATGPAPGPARRPTPRVRKVDWRRVGDARVWRRGPQRWQSSQGGASNWHRRSLRLGDGSSRAVSLVCALLGSRLTPSDL